MNADSASLILRELRALRADVDTVRQDLAAIRGVLPGLATAAERSEPGNDWLAVAIASEKVAGEEARRLSSSRTRWALGAVAVVGVLLALAGLGRRSRR
jgi:hypothetical protein